MNFKAIRGTNDHIPEDMAAWNFVERVARNTAAMFGYKEISTPIFEQTALFKRAVGEGTDVVQKEMYNFNDLGGNELTLRPEGTASVCRAFIEHGMHNKPYPVRLFYIAPMFRHERPQSGRLRQHHQFGVEIFGDKSAETDLEIILLGLTYLDNLGIKDLKLKVNSIGTSITRIEFKKSFENYMNPLVSRLSEKDQKKYELNPIRILDSKESATQDILADSPKPIDFLDEDSNDHWEKFVLLLEESIKMFKGVEFEIDKGLVRGLDYYSRTVFEIQPKNSNKAQSSILSGGRYDNLIENIGGPDTPAAGFGSGIERVILNMNEKEYEDLDFTQLLIIPASEEGLILSIKIAQQLRNKKIPTSICSSDRSFKAQMRYANQINAKNVIVLGNKEIESNKISIKNLSSKIEKTIDLTLENILSVLDSNG